MQAAIEAYLLTKRYGAAQAIEEVSFQIFPGEIVGFLGPNGAGKSTTLKILSGLIPATAGEAYICGHSVARFPQRIKDCIGYMPENNPLPEDMRIEEYLHMRAELKGIVPNMRKPRVQAVMKLADLDKKVRNSLILNLSKGYKQRLGLADALLAEPPVIILDEPTIGLDPHQLVRFRQMLDQLRGHMTILISSHILSEIEACCDRVIIINHGHLIAAGKPSDLRKEFFPYERFRLEVQQDVETTRHLLKSFRSVTIESITSTTTNGSVAVLKNEAAEPMETSGLVAALGSLGLAICAFSPLVPSLEDIFILATKRCWDSTCGPFPK
ncbi:MAG: hypothetical protein B7X06_03345 [Verrucomicrobia bacterium 21-51-4]|nr:MAG: hypothetical protein B7X06_03345 [Verrucomicrobia bacterium 21-51-4]